MTTTKTGTREWSEHSVNWQLGCSNGCLYCYARQQALRFKRIKTPEEWTRERPLKARMPDYSRKIYSGVVMCPTQHDITPANLPSSIEILTRLASNGNKLLIVSKPRMECIEPMLHDLKPWRDNVEFRFSIGCLDESLAAIWEPGAPRIFERMQCLKLARLGGFTVSASCEPLLEPWKAPELVDEVRYYGAGDIWLGCLNRLRSRVGWAEGDDAVAHAAVQVALWQRPQKVREVFDSVKDVPGIRFKDSYRRILGI
jgi:DNA repair photolyase